MTTEKYIVPPGIRASRARLVYFRVAVLLLLVAIAGFSTAAKNSQYYSRSNPAHYLNISSKMKVSAAPVTLDRAPLPVVERLIAPTDEIKPYPVVDLEVPEIPSLAVTLTLQHRSPPSLLS
jgi:hypothetical protein